MKTRTKTVEIEEAYVDLTRDQLMSLRSAMLGGNAIEDNRQLMRHVADRIGQYPCLAAALRERAAILDGGIKQIEALIWPDQQ